ncbi:MAG TPA: hypothetical protein PLL30_02500 [Candidatus Krumholzibacteria bacterium]|nr:hypothetical protein [Candidatus Krumholzibacteria bacterium]HPD70639.1 hypothetical protein [Candidatus Krumholzibacteria bacterium]HRY39661.1 hypothetical protein [Candidatus Krumholzibacteria bacterium]
MPAASVSLNEMTSLMAHLPRYASYGSGGRAVDAERIFRRSLGRLLKDCGDHLLNVAEQRAEVLSTEQVEIIDLLVDHISSIFRRLDREGIVAIAGDPLVTVPELEELDNRLLLLAEASLSLTRALDVDQPSENWFRNQAIQLSQILADLSRTAEERNYLLGLGWESEFARMRRR